MIAGPIPQEITRLLAGERTDFIVKSRRIVPLKKALPLLLFGLFWLAMTGTLITSLVRPLLIGKSVTVTVSGIRHTVTREHPEPLLVPGIIMGVFLIIGVGLTGGAVYQLSAPGGWFAGTPTRLLVYRGGSVRTIDWEQFSGNIDYTGSAESGDIALQMRTGRWVSRKHGPDRFEPDVIYLVGIDQGFFIQERCRQRIKENDPTPPREGAR